MKKNWYLFRIIIFGAIFVGLKYLSDLVIVGYFILNSFIQFGLVFILAFTLGMVLDFSKSYFSEKLKANLILSLLITLLIVLISIIKFYHPEPLTIGLINTFSFALLAALPLIRDRFFYNIVTPSILWSDLLIIPYFVLLKLVFNTISVYYIQEITFQVNIIYSLVFVILLFIFHSFIVCLFIKAFVEYDGKEYPIFNTLRVGRSQSSDIIVDDHQAPKSTFFIISAKKKKLSLRTAFEMKVDNRTVAKNDELQDGETINCRREYFTIINHKGHFFKRFSFIFFSLVILIVSGFAQDHQLVSFDFSFYPQVNSYVFFDSEIIDFVSKEDVVIIENKKSLLLNSLEQKNYNIDLVFLLDVTGTLTESYIPLSYQLKTFCQNLKKEGKSIRIGMITFADDRKDMVIYPLSKDYQKIGKSMSELPFVEGMDFKENPYEAILELKEMNFQNQSQKIVVLITDAPPHVKGDYNKERVVDYRFKTTEFMDQFIKNSNYHFIIASFERYEDYQQLIDQKNTQFYDIEQITDLSKILDVLEYQLVNQVKITYTSQSKTRDFAKYKQNVQLKIGEDAVLQKKNDKKRKILLSSFFQSLFDFY
ncbi:MAG: VWA domain-containing protein [Spirochaetes bacterium]|nr:VWA domain-containing protein [Spirochaetota bacterium]